MKKEFIDYLTYQKQYSINTISNYSLDIDKFELFLKSKNYNYLLVNYLIISQYVDYLNILKLSGKTISRNLSSLRSYYNFLLKQKQISSNPFELISGIKIPKKLPNYLQYNEFEKILENCNSDELGIRNRSILEMLLASGLRVSELVNIKLSDVNFKEQSIKVIGKGEKQRIVYYGDYCKESLNNYINLSRNNLLNGKSSDYLYINHLGDRLTRRGVELIIEQISRKANLNKKISPHTFRHTFATMMINEGASVKTVQELLGHSNLNTTSIYTHISNNRLRSVYLKTHPRARK